MPRRLMHLALAAAVLLPFVPSTHHPYASAATPCASTAECEAKLRRPGSACVKNADGVAPFCSNPLASGCLRAVLGADLFPGRRVCNSDDVRVHVPATGGSSANHANEDTPPPPPPSKSNCDPPQFDYPEVRLLSGNWETSMFLSFALQIVLSELLGVPATIETGNRSSAFLSFYDESSGFPYDFWTYGFDGLEVASRLADRGHDCRLTSEPCGHVIPEVWMGHRKRVDRLHAEGHIEMPAGDGMVDKLGWYIPAFLAEQDPTLVSFYGLAGESNRRKLAQLFNRPTTWEAYCLEVSDTNCTVADGVAARKPGGPDEEGSYYSADAYTGYFRPTDKNDCSILVPSSNITCSGHIVDASCEWATFVEAQAYWNNIKLESDGPIAPNGGYSHSQMKQIWAAANATRSPVIMLWYRGDPLFHQFEGSPGHFMPVTLPLFTRQCDMSRISNADRCSVDPTARRGQELGSCDSPSHALQKLMVSSWRDRTYDEPEVTRSPAYETLKDFRVGSLRMHELIERWLALDVDRHGYDTREAVCTWVADNIDLIKGFVPNGYPREYAEQCWYCIPVLYMATAFAAVAVAMVLATLGATYYWRKKQVMVYAQVNFLFLMIYGFLMVSVSAVLFVLKPSYASCVSKQWLISLGYTLCLVPLLVKVAAINKLMNEAKKMKRATVTARQMYGAVALVMALVVAFLTIWTATSPPKRPEETLSLKDESVVELTVDCTSSSSAWVNYCLHGWEFLLLVCASILAFQSRHIRQEFNEAHSISLLVYSHFLFAVLRAIPYFVSTNPNTAAGVTSIVVSLDNIFAICIYFRPKFVDAWHNRDPKENSNRRHDRAGGNILAVLQHANTLRELIGAGSAKETLSDANVSKMHEEIKEEAKASGLGFVQDDQLVDHNIAPNGKADD